MFMKYRIRYRRAQIAVNIDRKGHCLACKKKGRTEFHHYSYEYTTKQARKDHQLAIRNTIELCYVCHKMADVIKKIDESPELFLTVARALIKKQEENHERIQP